METTANEALIRAWDFVEYTSRSIFLTGKAGTGKTTFLKTVVQQSKKRLVVVAPTGVAAINAGGVTIHSFFQLPFTPYVPNSRIQNKFDFSKEKRRIIASLDLLIIDEISMVRSDLLDAVDTVLRRYRNRYQPFGGVQLLMIGDLQQLTPVVTPGEESVLSTYYDTPYFFGSHALRQIDYVTIQLEKVYRQQDGLFLDILNHIREAHITADDLTQLNRRCVPDFVPRADEGYIRLTTHNYLADNYNDSELAKLPGGSFTFRARIEGTFPEYAYPTSEELVLKDGAQVMFMKNDPSGEHRYYNGRIGRIVDISDTHVQVLCPGDAEAIDVEPLVWENTQYQINPETREIETRVQGRFHQLPLRLAWAITIHKSQGLTFDHAIIDANLSFAPGQVYVALSRCKTLEGMVLSAPLDARAVITDERVESYISRQESEAQRSIAQLPQLKEEYYRQLLLELFDFHDILYREEHLVRLMSEFFYHSHTDLTERHKRVFADFGTKVMTVADKWELLLRQQPLPALREEAFHERVRRSATYFEETIDTVFGNVLQLSKEVKSNNKRAMKQFPETLADVRQAVLSRRYLLQRIAELGFDPGIYLHEKQLALLDALDEDQLKQRGAKGKKAKKPKAPKAPKEKTWDITRQLYDQGLKPEEIARKRDLTLSTVMGHLARFVISGDIPLSELVPEDHQEAILRAIRLKAPDEGRGAIKNLCPPEITYEEITLFQATMM